MWEGQAAHETQHRRAARRHAQVIQQACPGRAAERHSNLALRVGQPVRALRPRGHQAGKPLHEGGPRAGGIAAVEAPDRQLQAHLPAEARQVSRAAHTTVMNGSGPLPAIGATPAPRRNLSANVKDAGIRLGHLSDPASGQDMRV